MHRYIGTFLLGASLLAPMAIRAADDHPDKRVYDRDHKDYHGWNDHEETAYKRWLEENHHAYREFSKENKRDQAAYWKWRHDHPD